MKLKDIKPIELQDLAGLGIKYPYNGLKENYIYPPSFDEWNLNEAAYRVDWQYGVHNVLHGYFSSPEYTYRINIEPFQYPIKDVIYNCANISFEVFKDDKPTTELTPTSFSNTVFGTVLEAASEKITQFDIDAIIFAANNNVEKRMSVYKKLANKFKKNFGEIYENIKLTNGRAIIIISNNIREYDRNKVYQFVLDQCKNK